MEIFRSITLSIAINCPHKKVYKFVSDINNLPKWAMTFCYSIKKSKGDWTIETPQGPLKIRITPKNEFGILDHFIVDRGVVIFVPMRVVQNGKGSEVTFTLFQRPEMSNEQYAQDIAFVRADLNNYPVQ